MWEAITERQRGYLNFSKELIDCIGRTRIAVIGTGGNGAVLDQLLRVGYQHFEIVDFDVVEATNLNRLPFCAGAVGTPKVQAWENYLKSINPACTVLPHHKRLTRADYAWLRDIIAAKDIVALGTSDIEANLVVTRICAELKKRCVIGPGSSGLWIVSTVTNEGDPEAENATGFGTDEQALDDIDFDNLRSRHAKLLMFPGRPEKYYPEVLEKLLTRQIDNRSCKIFVSMVNAAMCWEIVKNTAVMNGLDLEGTRVTEFPVFQIFDPYKGSAFYYNVQEGQLGIPNWLTGDIEWHEYKRPKE